ncbi:MAG: hypothetical protein JHC95_21435 [Solirubrobacteraceae bacterium]|nr:hypothetical protein [Solirubrobacteraceae bacterium]
MDGIATIELTAHRRGAGRVAFTGTADFGRGTTTLERTAPDSRLWIELAGDEITTILAGEPERRLIDPHWAGRDVGRSGAGVLAFSDGRPDWARAVILHVTGIAPGWAGTDVQVDDVGRPVLVEIAARGLLGRPRVTHALRLSAWR